MITLAVLLSLIAVPAKADPEPAQTPEERAAALVAQMTLDEKISQVHTTGRGAGNIARLVQGIPRLGIPDFLITNGPAGVGTGAVPQQSNATALPAPVALATSFDTDLAHRYGVLQGVETNNVGHSPIELRDNGPYDEALKQVVLAGRVSTQALDTMIIRILATQIRAGLFERPRTVTPIDAAAGGAVACTVAEQSAVLLKNSAGQLPLDAAALRSIAVIGPYARIVHPGGGSSHVNPLYTVTPVDGIQRRVGPALAVGSADGTDTAAAAQLAASADVAVAVVIVGGEGANRPNLSLPGNQDDLVRAVVAANPRTVVVLNSGAPVLLPWVETVPAIPQA